MLLSTLWIEIEKNIQDKGSIGMRQSHMIQNKKKIEIYSTSSDSFYDSNGNVKVISGQIRIRVRNRMTKDRRRLTT